MPLFCSDHLLRSVPHVRARSRVARLIIGVLALSAPPAESQTISPGHGGGGADEAWRILGETRVEQDRDLGLYFATFAPQLAAMEGKPLRVAGYLIPLEPSPAPRHVLMTRRDSGCPFCAPAAPTEAVEVWLIAPLNRRSGEVRLVGTLRLIRSGRNGLFFRLDAAGPVN